MWDVGWLAPGECCFGVSPFQCPARPCGAELCITNRYVNLITYANNRRKHRNCTRKGFYAFKFHLLRNWKTLKCPGPGQIDMILLMMESGRSISVILSLLMTWRWQNIPSRLITALTGEELFWNIPVVFDAKSDNDVSLIYFPRKEPNFLALKSIPRN